jgi:hypothetical protein
MRRIGRGLLGVALVCAGLSVSPALAGKYTNEEESSARAEPREGFATVYVVRKATMGAAIYFWTFADEQLLGVTRGPGYTWAYLEPGRYTIWSHAENVSGLTLDVEADRAYYVRQTALVGFGKARVRTEIVDEQEWLDLMRKAKRISTPTEAGLVKAREIADEHLGLAREKAARGERD